jgi:hypothetical protein
MARGGVTGLNEEKEKGPRVLRSVVVGGATKKQKKGRKDLFTIV